MTHVDWPPEVLSSTDETLRLIAEEALGSWLPAGRVRFTKSFSDGRSGACVLLVDLDPGANGSGFAPNGAFVLKLVAGKPWEGEPPEADRHRTAASWHADFARDHIPELVKAHEAGGGHALLYRVTGTSGANSNSVPVSLDRIVSVDRLPEYGQAVYALKTLSKEMLDCWNACCELGDLLPGEVLAEWLGYRLGESAPLRQVVSRLTGDRRAFTWSGEVLVNPIWLCDHANDQCPEPSVGSLHGRLHGDLHSCNILVEPESAYRRALRFWLIDFALARQGPLLYDHAYLETGLLLNHQPAPEGAALVALLRALDHEADTLEARRYSAEFSPLAECVRAVRQGLSEWQVARQPDRVQAVSRQWRLARVAAALNYANKPIGSPSQDLAVALAAWHTRRFVEEVSPMDLDDILRDADTHKAAPLAHSGTADVPSRIDAASEGAPPPSSSGAEPLPHDQGGPGDTTTWSRFLADVHHFSPSSAAFALVCGEVREVPEAGSIGVIPWSVVIDFDSYESAADPGLLDDVRPVLTQRRGLHLVGLGDHPDVEYRRGTLWMLAAGSRRIAGEQPADGNQWRRHYLPAVRSACAALRNGVAPRPIVAVVVAGAGLSGSRLNECLLALQETIGDTGRVLLVDIDEAAVASVDPDYYSGHYPLTVEDFVAGIAQLGGTTVGQDVPTIPGISSDSAPVRIPLDALSLHSLEEDLDIVHSLAAEQNRRRTDEDSFWRGNPPTWADIDSGHVLNRSIVSDILKQARARLEERETGTIPFYHAAGSGATTAALLAGWEIHDEYPVAVLRRYSALTASRLGELFQLSGKPVFLVAENSVLPVEDREQLYRTLEADRTRVVILHLVRMAATDGDSRQPDDESTRLVLGSSMSPGEAGMFLKAYERQTTDPTRRAELRKLATDPAYAEYRLPFFFGLFTYEEEFQSLREFTQRCLASMSHAQRDVLDHLAVVTAYTQVGLPSQVVADLVDSYEREDAETESSPNGRMREPRKINREQAQPFPAGLVVRRQDELRILHPVLARAVLRETWREQHAAGTNADEQIADQWRSDLGEQCRLLIEAIVDSMGSTSSATGQLLEELFVRREAQSLQPRDRRHFSPLVLELPSEEAQAAVFAALTDACPNNPHYWNHRGRHCAYIQGRYAEAVMHIRQAVRLDDRSLIHHHTLGLVHRLWIEALLDDLRQSARPGTQASDVLQCRARGQHGDEPTILELFEAATAAFGRARDCAPDSDYGYITHAQLVLAILEAMQQLAPGRDLAELDAATAEWVQSQILSAEGLLSQVRQLQAKHRDLSRHLVRCTHRLDGLLGDYEATLAAWRSMLATRPNDSVLLRAIPMAIVAAKARNWGDCTEHELREVSGLLVKAIDSGNADEADLRRWFLAYTRLPEYRYSIAAERLEAWIDQWPRSVDGHYYLYIIRFLALYRDGHNIDSRVQSLVERCRELSRRQGTNWSFNWYGERPVGAPLVHYRELGRRLGPGEGGLYGNERLLTRVRGVILPFESSARGEVQIEGCRLKAFWVPGREFHSHRDANTEISFYLGFSYEGLRAWSPRRV